VTDDRLLELHRRAYYARWLLIPVVIVAYFVRDWPDWLAAIIVLPPLVVGFLAALVVVPWCRWVEERRGWPEPGEMVW